MAETDKCQQLFSLSDLPPPRLQISFSVVSRYPIVYSSHSLAVPPPRLQKSVPVFRIAVISDKWYPIMYGSNCQCFSCFLFISDNSNNYPFYRFFSVIAAALKTSESPEVPKGTFRDCKQSPRSRASPDFGSLPIQKKDMPPGISFSFVMY